MSAIISNEERLLHLRLKLKAWERDFASANDGRTPTREEINQNAKIAARYKEYQKLQKVKKSGTSIPNSPRQNTQSLQDLENRKGIGFKTQPPHSITGALSYHAKEADQITASPLQLSTSATRQFDTPKSVRTLKFSKKEFINPTPQRNGKVLGIFESLLSPVPARSSMDSPAKRRQDMKDAAFEQLLDGTRGTRNETSPCAKDDDDQRKDDFLATPCRKRRRDGMLSSTETPKSSQPPIKSASPDPFSTPAFFRTNHFNFADESPQIMRPRQPPKRGLSSILADLRQLEDEALDEEENILREMEMEELKNEGGIIKIAASTLEEFKDAPAAITTAGIQGAGFVGKTWTKKGLKRQTKRHKIKPVRKADSDKDPDGSTTNESTSEAFEKSSAILYDAAPSKVLEYHCDASSDSEDGESQQPLMPSKDIEANKVKLTDRKIGADSKPNFKRLKIRGNAKANSRPGRFSRRKR